MVEEQVKEAEYKIVITGTDEYLKVVVDGGAVWKIARVRGATPCVLKNAEVIARHDDAVPEIFESAVRGIYTDIYNMTGKAIAVIRNFSHIKPK